MCFRYNTRYFLALLITASFISLDKTIAQTQVSEAFSGAVNRNGSPSNLSKSYFIFNPDVQTKANPSTNPNSVNTITDGQDIRIFPSANVQAEVHVSINKLNPNNLVASANTYLNTFNQGYYYTLDGGNTWNGADQLQHNPGSVYGDPSTAFSANGRAHITTLSTSAGYLTQNSTNGGVTWSNLINGTNQSSLDKEMVASDNLSTSPFANNIYCAWTILQSEQGPYYVNFNRSTDNGTSYSSPITLKPNSGMGQGTNVQTGPNGEVYVCWADYDVDGSNKVHFPSRGLGFCSSTNGGVTFATYRRVLNYTGIRTTSAPDPLFNNTGVNDFPAMAVDKSNGPHRGRIYVVVADKENGNGKAVVVFTYSDNQGSTWANPVTISIAAGRQNWFPWITVDDCTGDVWATYYTFDFSSGFATNTYVTHSTDGGVTWESQKVSDVSHITAPINDNIFRPGYAGDYIGITAFGGKVYPVWMDNRNGTWQLYCSPVSANNISGDDFVCGTSNAYSIVNLPASGSVSWSISPASGFANLSCTNCINPTLTRVTNGTVTLTANVSTGCGTNFVANKNVTIGNPFPTGFTTGISNYTNYSGPLQTGFSFFMPTGQTGTATYNITDSRYSAFTWTVVSIPPGTSWSTQGPLNQQLNTTVTSPASPVQSNIAIIRLSAQGPCGSYTQDFTTTAVRSSSFSFSVAPNPSSGNVTVNSENNTALKSNSSNLIYGIKITDRFGRIQKSFEYKSGIISTSISLIELNSGLYIISVFDGHIWSSQQLIIEK